jgi:hypothetical protein
VVTSQLLADVRAARDLNGDLFWRVAETVGFLPLSTRVHQVRRWVRAEAWESAVIALIETVLPGWAWKIGTCSVSDDAWLVPDFNCPVHGERLRAEFDYPDNVPAGSIWDSGVDIDRRPAGNTALALLEALLAAWEQKGASHG